MKTTRRPTRPRYDLVEAQRREVRIPKACVGKANQLLGMDDTAARQHIQDLFLSLVPADFAHVEVMSPKHGGKLLGDVYGKRDDFGVWFVKFHCQEETTTVILSCHETEQDLPLADGRTLRRGR